MLETSSYGKSVGSTTSWHQAVREWWGNPQNPWPSDTCSCTSSLFTRIVEPYLNIFEPSIDSIDNTWKQVINSALLCAIFYSYWQTCFFPHHSPQHSKACKGQNHQETCLETWTWCNGNNNNNNNNTRNLKRLKVQIQKRSKTTASSHPCWYIFWAVRPIFMHWTKRRTLVRSTRLPVAPEEGMLHQAWHKAPKR